MPDSQIEVHLQLFWRLETFDLCVQQQSLTASVIFYQGLLSLVVQLNQIAAVSPQEVPSAFVGNSDSCLDLRAAVPQPQQMSSKDIVPVTKEGTARKERIQYLLRCVACEKLCLCCWMSCLEEYLTEQLGCTVPQKTQSRF